MIFNFIVYMVDVFTQLKKRINLEFAEKFEFQASYQRKFLSFERIEAFSSILNFR